MTSNGGMPTAFSEEGWREAAIVEAYAVQRVSSAPPEAMSPALKK
jgi:hypothetical protein